MRPAFACASSASARRPARTARASRAMSTSSIARPAPKGPGMSVEVGWSKDPNAKVNWNGGPVSGVIGPDRANAHAAGRRERAAGPGAERAAVDSSPSPTITVPTRCNGSRSRGDRAGHLWAGRAQAADEEPRPMSGEQHILANGLTVAVDPLPGAESVALGLYASVGSRSEPAAARRPRASRRAYGVQGRRRPRHARARRSRSRTSAARSTPGPRATRRCSTAARWPATCRWSPN